MVVVAVVCRGFRTRDDHHRPGHRPLVVGGTGSDDWCVGGVLVRGERRRPWDCVLGPEDGPFFATMVRW